jgi:acyl dehydratase
MLAVGQFVRPATAHRMSAAYFFRAVTAQEPVRPADAAAAERRVQDAARATAQRAYPSAHQTRGAGAGGAVLICSRSGDKQRGKERPAGN